MKSIALISAVQAGFGDGARQVRGLFPYEACVENVGPVNVDRGEYACHGHKCSIDTCDDGYHRVALIPGAKKNMKCKHNRKTDSYSWSAPALWSCTSCANPEPLSDDDRFNVQCSYRKVGNYKLKQCTYSCANGQNIYPLNQKKVKNVVCKCNKTEATSHCKWRKGSQTYDEGGAHDFYNWSCPMPHQLPTGLQCTKSNYPASKLVISRPPPSKIVGGEEAVEHSWPWIVRLDIHGGLCGGTILDDKERTVLTAAHCCEGATDILVFAADHDQYDYYEGKEIEFEIDEDRIFMHSGYNDVTFERDMCILKLRNDESFGISSNSEIDYACLPEPNQEIEPGTKCWTAGWGTLSSGGNLPDKLREVDLQIMSDEQCAASQLGDEYFASNMMCAGYPEGGKDACQGDSGGPLICAIDGQPVLVGVTSWGFGCAWADNPGVWAKVSSGEHYGWIVSMLDH